MKKIALAVTMILIFGLGGNLWAYEGGTKVIATVTHPKRGINESGPVLLAPHHELTPSKLFVQLLHQVPEPTLSVDRIREEKPGRSLGTKGVVLFQKGR